VYLFNGKQCNVGFFDTKHNTFVRLLSEVKAMPIAFAGWTEDKIIMINMLGMTEVYDFIRNVVEVSHTEIAQCKFETCNHRKSFLIDRGGGQWPIVLQNKLWF
jgi:hypothetical protein